MKPTITFELIAEQKGSPGRSGQRVYRASEHLTKDADGKPYPAFGEVKKLYAHPTDDSQVKEWVTPDYFDHVVVSDAHTHTERLAFPAWEYEPVRNKTFPFLFTCDTIAGVNTMMIHGGDSSTVKPDAVYLRMIAKGNGFQYTRGENPWTN